MRSGEVVTGSAIVVETGPKYRVSVVPYPENRMTVMNATADAACQVQGRINDDGELVDIKCRNVDCRGECKLQEISEGSKTTYVCTCSTIIAEG